MPEGRYALVVAGCRYDDPDLRSLNAPARDAIVLADLLRDPSIGGFELRKLVDEPSSVIEEEIEAFFSDRRHEDLLLLYFSGHGVKDDDGKLYFAARNTKKKRLRSTGVSGDFVRTVMRESKSRRQVLLLDCCYSGAILTSLSKGDPDMHIKERFEGSGQIVVTASDSMQPAYEGGGAEDDEGLSIFTRSVVEGIRSGEADVNGDGHVSLDELFSYACDRVQELKPSQTPKMTALDRYGDLVIAWTRQREEEEARVAPPEPAPQPPAPEPVVSQPVVPQPVAPQPPLQPVVPEPAANLIAPAGEPSVAKTTPSLRDVWTRLTATPEADGPDADTPERQEQWRILRGFVSENIVAKEVHELPKQLLVGERILSAAKAERFGWQVGVLAATDKRLVWVYARVIGGFSILSLLYDQIADVTVSGGMFSKSIKVAAFPKDFSFSSITPKPRADEIAGVAKARLTSANAGSSTS